MDFGILFRTFIGWSPAVLICDGLNVNLSLPFSCLRPSFFISKVQGFNKHISKRFPLECQTLKRPCVPFPFLGCEFVSWIDLFLNLIQDFIWILLNIILFVLFHYRKIFWISYPSGHVSPRFGISEELINGHPLTLCDTEKQNVRQAWTKNRDIWPIRDLSSL